MAGALGRGRISGAMQVFLVDGYGEPLLMDCLDDLPAHAEYAAKCMRSLPYRLREHTVQEVKLPRFEHKGDGAWKAEIKGAPYRLSNKYPPFQVSIPFN